MKKISASLLESLALFFCHKFEERGEVEVEICKKLKIKQLDQNAACVEGVIQCVYRAHNHFDPFETNDRCVCATPWYRQAGTYNNGVSGYISVFGVNPGQEFGPDRTACYSKPAPHYVLFQKDNLNQLGLAGKRAGDLYETKLIKNQNRKLLVIRIGKNGFLRFVPKVIWPLMKYFHESK